ncbi:uncharacterized protein MONBRDRAFT_9420 [Monosiga brevicollis MX1]|uniref:ABC transporter domain-containing protein n=1 Tax=Monosiga brevicollis TaxID=81824 RepID=A9V332_MONBE|nr:uncharacterized protein MONBRDRAFT_9420 [Monosiga brevicollis MX1]EDQ88118.1 predicted protein [Monosiga brevicollis MX1]|eukprot:XP_001747194.1 hypothetical protein [Monosiga brevicollis MX1]
MLLELHQFGLSVGSTQLIENANAHIVDGQRIALIGPNGCGKSTLLRALAQPSGSPPTFGHQSPASASPREATRGAHTADPEVALTKRHDYFLIGTSGLRGSLAPASRASAKDEAANADTDEEAFDENIGVLLVEQDDLHWTHLLGSAAGTEAELREMTVPEALDMAAAVGGEVAVEHAEAWRQLAVAADHVLEWRTAGYDSTPIQELSPGSAVRAYLGLALLRPGVRLLLLDEPTNHLDLPSVMWLQAAIQASGKAVLMVSHDTAFLDAVANQVWAIDPATQTLTVAHTTCSKFLAARELALQQQEVAYEEQQERLKKLTAVANNLRSASTAGSHMVSKDNDKLQRDLKRDRAGRSGRKASAMQARIEREPMVERVQRRRPLRIVLDALAPDNDSAIVLDHVTLGYDSALPLPIPPISLRIDYGERIAIVGFNGVGKSTLLRALVGMQAPLSGDVRLGRALRLGNLTQEHETLPPSQTPRQYMADLTGLSAFDAGARLMQYGLTVRQVDSLIGELNPGARARALLAGFAARAVNLLVLDEPTNHLDTEAVAEVTATLNSYAGTVVVVSHSQEFLSQLQLTRIYRLSSDGLLELASLADFVDLTTEAVQSVVEKCWPA